MMAGRFAPRSDTDVADLVARHPLAFLVSSGAGRLHATPLPMRIERRDGGRIASLTGHMASANPQVAALRADPRATLLFLGAHGYVSPSWLSDRTQAPTWNYVCANFAVQIDFLDDAASRERIVRDLVDALETGRERAWNVDDMGARYALLAARISAFRATVTAVEARFKLGQDERDDVYPEIIAGLRAEGGHAELIAMMRLFNAQRGEGERT
jgi:transcriptional regulator